MSDIRTGRLARWTFWLVFVQAVIVIIILAVTLQNVAERSAQAQVELDRIEQVVIQNQQLFEILSRVNTANQAATIDAIQGIQCALLILPAERTSANLSDCFSSG